MRAMPAQFGRSVSSVGAEQGSRTKGQCVASRRPRELPPEAEDQDEGAEPRGRNFHRRAAPDPGADERGGGAQRERSDDQQPERSSEAAELFIGAQRSRASREVRCEKISLPPRRSAERGLERGAELGILGADGPGAAPRHAAFAVDEDIEREGRSAER